MVFQIDMDQNKVGSVGEGEAPVLNNRLNCYVILIIYLSSALLWPIIYEIITWFMVPGVQLDVFCVVFNRSDSHA